MMFEMSIYAEKKNGTVYVNTGRNRGLGSFHDFIKGFLQIKKKQKPTELSTEK